MSIEIIRLVVHKGQEYAAVEDKENNCKGCVWVGRFGRCAALEHQFAPLCGIGAGTATSVIWLKLQDALIARVKGSLP